MKILGFDRVWANLGKIDAKINKEIKDHVNRTSQLIRTEALIQIQQGEKTGKDYVKYKPFYREHKASAKGEAPATDTGYLARELKANFFGLTAEVISNADYSYQLEINLDRPFLYPAMEKYRSYFTNKLGKIKRGKF